MMAHLGLHILSMSFCLSVGIFVLSSLWKNPGFWRASALAVVLANLAGENHVIQYDIELVCLLDMVSSFGTRNTAAKLLHKMNLYLDQL